MTVKKPPPKGTKQPNTKPSGGGGSKPPTNGGVTFVTVYKHWRTGKLMYAKDYGYSSWPLR